MARLTRLTLLTLAIAWFSVPRIESVLTKNDFRKKSEDICSLPCTVGRCRAAFPRWFFNSTTGTCEKFIYGGCDGNENNFESLQECRAACEKPHNKENGDSKSQYKETAEEFHVLLEKGRNPNALREFVPRKQRQHILPSLLMRRSNLDEGKSSQLEKTEEVYKKLNKLNVHPEDLRVLFPVRRRFRRDENNSENGHAEVDHAVKNITNNPQDGGMSQGVTESLSTSLSESATASTSGRSTTASPSLSSTTASLSSSTQIQPKSTTIKVKPVAAAEEPSTAPAEKAASTAAEGKTTTSSTAAEGKTTTSSTAAEGKTTTSTAAEGKTTTSTAAKGETTTPTTTAAPTSSTTVASTSPITTTTTAKQAEETTTTVPITTSTTATTSLIETTTTTAAPSTSVEASSSTVTVITNYEENVPDTDGSHKTRPGGYPDASSSSEGEAGNVPDAAGPEGSQTDNQDFYNVPRRNQLQEHTSSHFAAFFLSSIVLVFAIYVAYHNRQKIIAIIIEGRSDNRRKPGYRKLEANVEEAMPSMRSTNTTYVY